MREARPDDIPRIADLAPAFMSAMPAAHLVPPERDRITGSLAAMVADPAHNLIVIEEDAGEIAGFLGLTIFEHPFSAIRVCAERFWHVRSPWQGQGLGGRLIAAGEVWARAGEADVLIMVTPGDDLSALYERHGYRKFETQYIKPLI